MDPIVHESWFMPHPNSNDIALLAESDLNTFTPACLPAPFKDYVNQIGRSYGKTFLFAYLQTLAKPGVTLQTPL